MIRSSISNGVVFLLAMSMAATSAFGQSRARDGAALGGVAGAVAGGIIGHQNDETPEGAIIGGAIGAIAGGLIGHSQDQTMAREYQYRQQLYQQQQQQMRAAVSLSEVVEMSRNGLSDSLIINHVRSRGVLRRLETSDIIALHKQGVSEHVIEAIQRAPIAGARPVASPPATPRTRIVREYIPAPRPPVVVREYHVVPRYRPSTGIYIHAGRSWHPHPHHRHFRHW